MQLSIRLLEKLKMGNIRAIVSGVLSNKSFGQQHVGLFIFCLTAVDWILPPCLTKIKAKVDKH